MPGASLTGPSIPALMGRVGGAVKAGGAVTLNKAAMKAKVIQNQHLAKAVGADMRMSGIGKRGARVSAYYKIDTRGEIPSARIGVRGPVHIIERPTKPHGIYPKGSRGVVRRNSTRKKVGPVLVNTKTGRSNMIMPPARGFRRSAMHPGTSGKYPFALGQEAVHGPVMSIIRGNMFRVIKSAAGVRLEHVR